MSVCNQRMLRLKMRTNLNWISPYPFLCRCTCEVKVKVTKHGIGARDHVEITNRSFDQHTQTMRSRLIGYERLGGETARPRSPLS